MKNHNIGGLIKQQRNAHGLTQERLAELSGVSVAYISKLESNSTQNVSLKVLDKLFTTLGIGWTEAFIWEDKTIRNRSKNPYMLQIIDSISQLEEINTPEVNNMARVVLQVIKTFLNEQARYQKLLEQDKKAT
ncbi:helix-turn-helix domain-containing protein [Lactobacillus psittaci]|uniref:HTH cro/C1-type domain-containing protein n=1 Tax=Lactobacillus psittaci DSM 15354 TaxID=1122152 RepID=A0A0R1S3S4_9LACO|nr:helix-turn-helix transcriptional regulator [Lactobacillus psittaci]KRL63612.1 hypothetical protein FC23_GL000521 [Lactobacillus psittaci DSM 15354]